MPDETLKNPPAKQSGAENRGALDAVIISLKAAISATIAVLCCNWIGLAQPVWAAVSAVVVSQASLHPSARDSAMRVVANLIGAFVGAGLSVLCGHALWVLTLAVLLTGLICHFARLDAALRSAYAAVVIVTFTTTGGAWEESRNRVFAVIIGCAATLAVGLLHSTVDRTPLRRPLPCPTRRTAASRNRVILPPGRARAG